MVHFVIVQIYDVFTALGIGVCMCVCVEEFGGAIPFENVSGLTLFFAIHSPM